MPILVPVTEAYYGKPKQLVAVEKDVAKIKEWIDYEYTLDGAKKKNIVDINKTREHDNLEKAFKEAFNIGECNIVFYGNFVDIGINLANEDAPISIELMPPNAFTLPQVLLNVKEKLPGQKFDPKNIKANIYIDKALIFFFNLSPEEIIAVMLHELGHNFDHSYFNIFSTVLPHIFMLGHVDLIKLWLKTLAKNLLLSPVIKLIMTKGFKAVETMKIKIPAPVNAFMSSVHVASLNMKEMFSYFGLLTGKYMVNFNVAWIKALHPRSIFGYAGEKYADSFATTYGYGTAVASFMVKLNRGMTQGTGQYTNPRNIPVVNVVYDFMKTTIAIPFAFSDPHPKHITRVYSQLKKLRRELNDPSIPKELKKEMVSQIVELEKLCDSMTEVRMQEETGMFFSAIMNKLSKDVFKGIDDPREVLELIWRHEA